MWDITDSRHDIQGRDDIANLGRMYHHLFVDILRNRWPDDARWMVHPDENSALDWYETHRLVPEIGGGEALRTSAQISATAPLVLRECRSRAQVAPLSRAPGVTGSTTAHIIWQGIRSQRAVQRSILIRASSRPNRLENCTVVHQREPVLHASG